MESEICPACKGSGEGSHDGSTCYDCRGTGEVLSQDDLNWKDELADMRYNLAKARDEYDRISGTKGGH